MAQYMIVEEHEVNGRIDSQVEVEGFNDLEMAQSYVSEYVDTPASEIEIGLAYVHDDYYVEGGDHIRITLEIVG